MGRNVGVREVLAESLDAIKRMPAPVAAKCVREHKLVPSIDSVELRTYLGNS